MSGPEYVFAASQVSRPDTPSVASKVTVRAWLNQPLESAARPGVAEVAGAVASYFTGSVALLAFPAWSRQVPETAAVALSGPEYVFGASQDASPETLSVAANVTPTGALYQPFALAARPGVAVSCGPVASYFRANERGETFPARSRQEPLTDAPALSGPEYVFAASQTSRPEVVSEPAKASESAWLYQPLTSPARLGVMLACGAVSSYFSVNVLVPLTLAAASVHVPVSATEGSSGPA